MNKTTNIICILVLMIIPSTLLAHPEPGFGFVDAEDKGQAYIEELVGENELSENWASSFSDLDNCGMRVINGKNRWVMTYDNVAGERIRVIMTPLGKFVRYELTIDKSKKGN